MKTDFLASGNQPVEAVFSSTGTYFSANPSFRLVKTSSFVYWKQYFLIPSFFLLMENITETWGKSNFKDEPYSCYWTPIFFDFFRYFLKWKPCFRIVKAYFSISFIRQVQTNFLPTETVFFWSELFCCYEKSLV